MMTTIARRPATIVIEHLIQASDTSRIYSRNGVNKLVQVQVMHKVYKSGGAEKYPSINWYKAEMGFFDILLWPRR